MPQSQELLMQVGFYGPANRKVVVPADLKALGVLDGNQLKRMIVLDQNYVQSQRRKWTHDVDAEMSR